MGKNRSFTGSRKATGQMTLGKEAYFQLMRKCRDANDKAKEEKKNGKT